MEALTITHWSLLALGALIMGMSKGGLPGAGNLTVAIYALVLEDALGPIGVPLSVGLLLPVLISADMTATLVYRKHTDWKFIIRLLPCFIVGTVLGWWVFDYFQGGGGSSSPVEICNWWYPAKYDRITFSCENKKQVEIKKWSERRKYA